MRQQELDFVNSTSKTKEERFLEKVSATGQAYAIYVWFCHRPGTKATTVNISDILRLNLNSTRRATNHLESKFGLLEKLEDGRIEPSTGKFNHYYRLRQ